jgi:hypothetical protein
MASHRYQLRGLEFPVYSECVCRGRLQPALARFYSPTLEGLVWFLAACPPKLLGIFTASSYSILRATVQW